jgi:beta-phosphoglucomutase-like phosphatase (HAD superfamily)
LRAFTVAELASQGAMSKGKAWSSKHP